MIQNNKEGIRQSYMGSSASNRLNELKTTLSLVQAAQILSLEGVKRAAASEILTRATQEFGINSTPATTGLILNSLSIGKVLTHGKSRFILDQSQLENIRKQISSQVDEDIQKLKSALEHFKELPSQIEDLQNQWKKNLELLDQQRQLTRIIAEMKNQPAQTYNLQRQLENLKSKARQVDEMEKECLQLSEKINNLPSLTEKKAAYENQLIQYQADVKELAGKESELSREVNQYREDEQQLSEKENRLQKAIKQLQIRNHWVELASLQEAIKTATKELDQLSSQLGEKRSLLDRLLHRKEGGG